MIFADPEGELPETHQVQDMFILITLFNSHFSFFALSWFCLLVKSCNKIEWNGTRFLIRSWPSIMEWLQEGASIPNIYNYLPEELLTNFRIPSLPDLMGWQILERGSSSDHEPNPKEPNPKAQPLPY